MSKTILDLCGGTGAWSKPYADAGYNVKIITLPEYDIMRCVCRITKEEAQKAIETRSPTGAFMTIDEGAIIGIDNTTGDAWTEEFKDIPTCIRWLKREEETQ